MTTITYIGIRCSERLTAEDREEIFLVCECNGAPGDTAGDSGALTDAQDATPSSADENTVSDDDYWYSDWQGWNWVPPARD